MDLPTTRHEGLPQGPEWSDFDRTFLLGIVLIAGERLLMLVAPGLRDSGPAVAYGVFGAGVFVLSFVLAFFDVAARYPRGRRAGWHLVLLGLNIGGVVIYWVVQRVRWFKARSAPTHSPPA